MKTSLLLIAALALPLAASAAAAQSHYTDHRHHVAMDSWDGRWTGEWRGNFGFHQVAITISGGRMVSYEVGGSTIPARVVGMTPLLVVVAVLDEHGAVVTMTRADVSTARARLRGGDGYSADAEMSRR